MRISLVTLAFSPALGRFVDEPLRDLLARSPATAVREHFFVQDNLPYLLCVVTHAEAAARRTTEPRVEATATPALPSTDSETMTGHAEERPRGPASPLLDLLRSFTPEQQTLFELLRGWRTKKAHAEGVPGYVILTNRQLVEIVRQRPASRSALVRIHGFGDKKLARHGAEVLALFWPETPRAEAAPGVATATEAVA